MKSVIVAAAIVTLTATAASAQETVIYRFAGASASGANGLNTTINCTNFSGLPADVRAALRDSVGNLLVNITSPIANLATMTFATNPGPGEVPLNFPGMIVVPAGTVAIAATTLAMICSAQVFDSSGGGRTGYSLRGVRFSPYPGSEE